MAPHTSVFLLLFFLPKKLLLLLRDALRVFTGIARVQGSACSTLSSSVRLSVGFCDLGRDGAVGCSERGARPVPQALYGLFYAALKRAHAPVCDDEPHDARHGVT